MPSQSSFSQFISCDQNRLIIRTPFPLLLIKTIIISAVILDVVFGVNLPVSLTFFLSEEISMIPKALNSSKLSCNRIENEIACSLSGNNLFGNIEKAFDSKHGKFVRVMRKPNNFRGTLYRNDLLILLAGAEEIPLYTSRSLVDDQYSQLNKFLEDGKQSKVLIQTKRTFDFNVSTFFEHLSYVFIAICCYLSVLIALSTFILYRINTNIYIFDKENGKLKIQRSYNRKLIREITLQRIKKIFLDKQIDQKSIRFETDLYSLSREGNNEGTYSMTTIHNFPKDYFKYSFSENKYSLQEKVIPIFKIFIYKIYIYDIENSFLFSINFSSIGILKSRNEAHKIAESICIFLQLPPYESNDHPPWRGILKVDADLPNY
ncbi:hypothetical protein APA_550 [Pseudanabaena sp. lw0831]|uniref:hypothetical protein n=1 Tax=Pseudanabaena sp. lw0831 TaxID=1357935 RepID=UPI001915E70F|nr:hypothetical protein [Pseudanabaena sp. lw0831]GBO51586.1 hypothetical protein APA_550 [Pseudanabaena sp. lw0831]